MPIRFPVLSPATMNAARLLLLTDVEGVVDRDGKLIPRLTAAEARRLISEGTINGGMIPKIETAIEAVESGVEAAVILDGRIPHVLLLELFTETLWHRNDDHRTMKLAARSLCAALFMAALFGAMPAKAALTVCNQTSPM